MNSFFTSLRSYATGGFLLWILLCFYLWDSQERDVADARENLFQRSRDLGKTLEGVLNPLIRRALIHHKDGVLEVLADVVKLGGFDTLVLLDKDQNVWMVAGEPLRFELGDHNLETPVFLPEQHQCAMMVPITLDFGRHPFKKIKEDFIKAIPQDIRERLKRMRSKEHKGRQQMGHGPFGEGRNIALEDKLRSKKTPKPNKGDPFSAAKAKVVHFVTVMSTHALEKEVKQQAMRKMIIAFFFLILLVIGLVMFKRVRQLHLARQALKEQELKNREWQEKSLAAAGLVHETRTPLSIIRGNIQMLSKNIRSPYDQNCDEILEEVDRITSRLNDFLEFARMREPNMEWVNFLDILSKLERVFEEDMEDMEVHFIKELPNLDWFVYGDSEHLEQVMVNIFQNALAFTPEGSKLKCAVELKGEQMRLCFSDEGPGVEEGQEEAIFQPYVTKREGGTGLGLSIVRQIMERHGAWVYCQNRDGEIEGRPSGLNIYLEGLKVKTKEAS